MAVTLPVFKPKTQGEPDFTPVRLPSIESTSSRFHFRVNSFKTFPLQFEHFIGHGLNLLFR
jgi:hypothetical protein